MTEAASMQIPYRQNVDEPNGVGLGEEGMKLLEGFRTREFVIVG